MNKKYNILFLSSWNSCPHSPTLGNFVERHAEAIALLHYIFFIRVCSSQQNKIIVEKKENLQIISVHYNKSRCRLINLYKYFKAYLSGFKKISNKIDIIHANVIFPVGLLALFFKWKLKIPFVLTEHWSIFLLKNKLPFWKKIIFKTIGNNADYIAPVSRYLKQMIQQNGIKTKGEIIYNSINTEVFKFKEKRENEYFHFVHISTLENNSKNTKGLLKAFKNLIDNDKKNLLTIISDGDISVAEQFISRFKISSKNIRLLKTQTAENIASFLQSADAYIQFSNYETFGLTIAEALCCGTPVISTRTGFLSEFKEFEIGLFVEAKNIKDLTKKCNL